MLGDCHYPILELEMHHFPYDREYLYLFLGQEIQDLLDPPLNFERILYFGVSVAVVLWTESLASIGLKAFGVMKAPHGFVTTSAVR